MSMYRLPPPPGRLLQATPAGDGALVVATTAGLFRSTPSGWDELQPDLDLVALAARGGRAAWSTSTGELWVHDGEPRRLAGAGPLITALALSPDEDRLAAGDERGGVTVWELRAARVVGACPAVHRGAPEALLWLDPTLLVSGGLDGRLVLLDPSTATTRAVHALPSAIRTLGLSGDIVATCADGSVHTLLPLAAVPLPRLRLRPTDDPLAPPLMRQLSAWDLLADDGLDTAIGPSHGEPLTATVVLRLREGPVEAPAIVPPLDQPPLGDDRERLARLGPALEEALRRIS